MRVKVVAVSIFLLMLLSAPSFLSADEGKQLFIKQCLNCHREGGKAPAINPADKAGRVWVKYFKRGRHVDNDKLVSSIGEDNLAKIIDYLKNNAADSDHPEAAVIPK